MTTIRFDDIIFEDRGEMIRGKFLKIFRFEIPRADIEALGDFTVKGGVIEFAGKVPEGRFNRLLMRGFEHLTNSVSGCRTIYIHRNSGIPLIGSNSFGIVDRDTDLIEVKPITSCNMDCVYCSVDEGKSTKKKVDYVVEEGYLVQEIRAVIEAKGCSMLDIHIGTQGEALLYSPIVDLVRDMRAITQVRKIQLGTNGALLTKRLIDDLVDAGLSQFNISLHTLDQGLASRMANVPCDMGKLREMTEYAAHKGAVILTPVLVPGMNDEGVVEVIEYAKRLDVGLGIQNYLNYPQGRNPVTQMPWERFYEILKGWEKRYGIPLIVEHPASTCPRKLQKPFTKGDTVKAEIKCPGRHPGESVAAAKGRNILVKGCFQDKGTVKVKISRSKHNVFIGQAA
jgi:hypothetical protein